MKKTLTSILLIFTLLISLSPVSPSTVEASSKSKSAKVKKAKETKKAKKKTTKKAKSKNLGKFKIYAYSKEKHGTRTASGKKAVAKKTIAADPKVLPMGTVVKISGLKGEYVVMDTGSSIKGGKIDIFVNTQKEAFKWGIKNRKITVVKWGKKK